MIKRAVPDARTAIGHGQMNGAVIEKVMLNFIAGKYDILIATTIIESGLDIPNANTIIINEAQNYGLSELHQLRGRVGRSNKKAFCYLLALPEISLNPDAKRRLAAIENFSDLGAGFHIALQDLDIRGAGNLLGAEQSGFIADIGLQTYNQILSEAVMELRETEFKELYDERNTDTLISNIVNDCAIDSDFEVMFPQDYITSTPERLNLYYQLDNLKNEEELQKFHTDITDRFGPMPEYARNLFEMLRIKWLAEKLGFEKLTLKQGKMLAGFISNSESAYYSSGLFDRVISYIQHKERSCKLKEKNDKLLLVFENIPNIETAKAKLQIMQKGVFTA